MAHVESASPEEARRVLSGPHRGWATFDEALEGARFQRLHDIVAAPTFDGPAARDVVAELAALARSNGYGTADGYHCDVAGMDDDEIEADPVLSIRRDHLEDPSEDGYFTEVRRSERIVLAAAATLEARGFLGTWRSSPGWDGAFGPVHDEMELAFMAGRDERAPDAGRDAAPAP